MEKFLIDPDDCLVCVAVQNSSSIREAAQSLGCDAGNLVRRIQRISDQHLLLEKTNGRWRLTPNGEAAIKWVLSSVESQKQFIGQKPALKIATTAWMAERLLIPSLTYQQMSHAEYRFSVPEKGFEKSMLQGEVDFVVVCHPPENPSIAHQQIRDEPWVAIAHPSDVKAQKIRKLEDLVALPFIRHLQLNPETLLPKSMSQLKYSAIEVDQLSMVRSAVLAKHGWSLVPKALVLDSIQAKTLIAFDYKLESNRKICVWWLRGSNGESGKSKRTTDFCNWIKSAVSVLDN